MSTNARFGYTEVADGQLNSYLTINNALAQISEGVNAVHTDSSTTLAVTITNAQYQDHQIFDFSGTHAAAYTVDFPAEIVSGSGVTTQRWFLFNNQDATYAATIDSDTGGGTTVEVEPGTLGVIYQDNLDFYLVAGGGGGAFVDLSDTPTDYTGGVGSYLLAVNSGATAVEFIDPTSLDNAGVGVGSYVFIEAADYAAVATADLVFDPAEFDHFLVKGWMKPVNDASELNMLISDDDGATYETAASYKWLNQWLDTGGTPANGQATGATLAQICEDVGNATDEYVYFEIEFPYMSDATLKQHWTGRATLYDAAGLMNQVKISGSWDVADEVNGAQFAFDTGNISDGRIEIYGIKALAPGALEINTVTATETLALNEGNKYLRSTSASAINVTVPPNSSVAFPIGTQIPGVQAGAGQVTFVAGAGVTINKPASFTLVTAEQGAGFALIKVATDEWDLTGQLV